MRASSCARARRGSRAARGDEELELALASAAPLELVVRAPRATPEQRAHGDARALGVFARRIELRGPDGAWRALDREAAPTDAGLSRARFDLPLNRGVVRYGDAFLVHSDWMGERILASRNAPTPIARVHHGCERRWRADDRRAARPAERRDAFVIASLGALQAHKRVDVVLRALALARREVPELVLVCAGEARPREVDHEALVRELGLGDAVHVTGWLAERAAWDELHAADLCVNLRGPSAGGTSGGLCQALSLGRAAVTSDLPELAHLPACVLRVPAGADEVARLARLFVELARDRARLAALEADARRAVDEELHWSHAAKRYVEALGTFPHARAARRSLFVRFYHATKRERRAPDPAAEDA
ncbi:MAG: glycosyltransferase family 4 protein [Planctomycetes bacterium]|nr:glycosyltransferase family 4 protein [Planctomycetota bacterium]